MRFSSSTKIKFECQKCGGCCLRHGEYGYVYLSLHDRRRLALHFGLTTREFTRQYTYKEEGLFCLKGFVEKCPFKGQKGCEVYDARPEQCRTWPFWPENMSPRAWKEEVEGFCPGVGNGPTYTKADIEKVIKR